MIVLDSMRRSAPQDVDAVTEKDFGRYLAKVEERDVDLLLLEEAHCDETFVPWLCTRLNLRGGAPLGAWHSVSETDGETDLLLRVQLGERRIGILIENKVGAPEQHQQAERYHLRGIRSREAGKFDDYTTVICAPRRYLEQLSQDSVYHHRIPYEEFAERFEAQEGPRARWRAGIMRDAIAQSRRGYTMQVSAVHTAFHLAYWEHLKRHHPRIRMAKPRNKGPKSTWIILAAANFPKQVKLHHKLDQHVMELGFERRRVEEIQTVAPEIPEGIILVQKNGTASLQVDVPPIDIKAGFAAEVDKIEQALASAYRLMPFACLLSADPEFPSR